MLVMFVPSDDTITQKNVQVCSTADVVLVSLAGETSKTCSTDQSPPGDVYLAPVFNSSNSATKSKRVEEYTLTTQIYACSECNFVCFQQNLSHNIRSIRVGNGHLDDIISVNYCKNIASNKQKNHTLQIATILLHHM